MTTTHLELQTTCRLVHLHLWRRASSGSDQMAGSLSTTGLDMMAWARSDTSAAHVAIDHDGECVLWLGHAAFEIRPQDAERIAATFGIRIDKPEDKPA